MSSVAVEHERVFDLDDSTAPGLWKHPRFYRNLDAVLKFGNFKFRIFCGHIRRLHVALGANDEIGDDPTFCCDALLNVSVEARLDFSKIRPNDSFYLFF